MIRQADKQSKLFKLEDLNRIAGQGNLIPAQIPAPTPLPRRPRQRPRPPQLLRPPRTPRQPSPSPPKGPKDLIFRSGG